MKAGFDAPLAAGCRVFTSREGKILTSSQSEENVSTIYIKGHTANIIIIIINKYFFILEACKYLLCRNAAANVWTSSSQL